MNYQDVYDNWSRAWAFVIDGFVCGDFSVPSPDDLAAAEEDEDDYLEDGVAFYVYGERGLKREYFVDRQMIESGKVTDDGMVVEYSDKEPLEITPLYKRREVQA